MSNKFIEFLKKLFKKADGFREGLENKLADVLDKIDENEEVDEAEKKLIEDAINYALEYYRVKYLLELQKKLARD